MTPPPTHLIHRQTLELSGNHFRTVQELEADAHRLMSGELHPVIDQCFENLGTGDTHLLIDKIEIDLGVFDSKEYVHEIGSRLHAKLTQALQAHRQYAQQYQSLSPVKNDTMQQDVVGPHLMSTADALLKSLLYYLRMGRLPWWWNAEDAPEQRWLQLDSAVVIPAALACLRQYRYAIPRAMESLSDVMLGKLAEEAGYGRALLQGWNEMQQITGREGTRHRMCRSLYWEYCLRRVTGHLTSIETETQMLIRVLRTLIPLTTRELEFFFAMVFDQHVQPDEGYFHIKEVRGKPHTDSHPTSESPLSTEESGDTLRFTPGNTPKETLTHLDVHDFSTEQLRGSSGVENTDLMSAHPSSVTLASSQTFSAGEAIVANAGMVIVHPFLEELFRSRGLLEGNAFVSVQKQSHAVRLLDYLVHGDIMTPEYNLLLPKLLCGMAWQDPISPQIRWVQEDVTACDDVLQAIIAHWRALGNTSADGLREGFLRRTGILERHGDDWRMRVEQKGQDILLNKLPWGIGTIHLPWMFGTLHVSWV